jgi:hypothetical protein
MTSSPPRVELLFSAAPWRTTSARRRVVAFAPTLVVAVVVVVVVFARRVAARFVGAHARVRAPASADEAIVAIVAWVWNVPRASRCDSARRASSAASSARAPASFSRVA